MPKGGLVQIADRDTAERDETGVRSFDSDAIVTSTTADLADVFQGYRTWAEATAQGRINVAGPPRFISAIPRWFAWSPWTDVTRERAQRAAVDPQRAVAGSRRIPAVPSNDQ